MMNVGGSEWLIIGLLVVVLLFGSKKLPEFSRSIGKAIGEFEKMRDETLRQKTDQESNYLGPRVAGAVDNERHKLEMIAESLGIELKGIGIGERAERLLVLAICGLIPISESIQWGVVIIIIISAISFVQRFMYVIKRI